MPDDSPVPPPKPKPTKAAKPQETEPNRQSILMGVLDLLRPLHDEDDPEGIARILSAACAFYDVEPKAARVVPAIENEESWNR
jgi:hypothetical protein